jgi:hypothetical protein
VRGFTIRQVVIGGANRMGRDASTSNAAPVATDELRAAFELERMSGSAPARFSVSRFDWCRGIARSGCRLTSRGVERSHNGYAGKSPGRWRSNRRVHRVGFVRKRVGPLSCGRGSLRAPTKQTRIRAETRIHESHHLRRGDTQQPSHHLRRGDAHQPRRKAPAGNLGWHGGLTIPSGFPRGRRS